MPCQHCEREFDPIRHRWLCPWCKTKNTCCEQGRTNGNRQMG